MHAKDFFSRHNLAYWKQVPYIGIGPSAHSYDGKRRRWNISSNAKYISELLQNKGKYYEYEELTEQDLFNEFILTSLRTMWGLDLDEAGERFGNHYVKYIAGIADRFAKGGLIEKKGNRIRLSEKGIFTSDYVMSEFFMVDDK